MDLYLDPATHDLVIGDGGALTFIDGGRAEVAQRIRIALETQRGEWVLDTTFGVQWRELAYVKNPDRGRLGADLRRVLSAVEGVTRVGAIEMEIDKATRTMAIAISASTTEGDVVIAAPTLDVTRPLFLVHFLGAEGASPGLMP